MNEIGNQTVPTDTDALYALCTEITSCACAHHQGGRTDRKFHPLRGENADGFCRVLRKIYTDFGDGYIPPS